MDVAGTLFEGILQKPVDYIDYVLVICLGLLDIAQLKHLFEITDTLLLNPSSRCSPNGLGQAI